MKRIKYRFFEFKTKNGFEDYCRASDLNLAKEVFKKFYSNKIGVVKEIFMEDYAPKRNKRDN